MKRLSFIFCLAIALFSCAEEKKNTVIALQTLNFFPDFYVDSISSIVGREYGLEVKILPNCKIPDQYFSNSKTPRYRADSILNFLSKNKQDEVQHILGLTCVDISTTKRNEKGEIEAPVDFYENWAVFGLANNNKPGAIVSTFRVQGPNQKLVIQRMQKVSIHYIGHNIGLPHCDSTYCSMHANVESFKTVDLIGLGLCSNCKKKAQQLCPKN
jgi:archaemetzincin